MTDKVEWPTDWAKLQAQYWNSFSELTRNAANVQANPSTISAPWHEGMQQWAQLFATLASNGSQNDLVERMLASAKSYLATMQSTLGSTFANPAAGFDGNAATSAWTDGLRNAFGTGNAFSLPGFDAALANNPLAHTLRDIGTQGAKSFEQLGAQLGPYVEAAKRESSALLNMPTFGLAREKQERQQQLILAWTAHEDAKKCYNAELAKSSQRSFEILEDKLAERSEPGRQIDSMRGFYDLWVDSSEEAFAEIAMSEGYRGVYADLVNTQMRLRGLVQDEIERNTRELGLPTRSEINSVEKRLHELRRELRRNAETDSGNVTDELTALRTEIAALKHAAANKSKVAPVAAAVKPKSSVPPRRTKPVSVVAANKPVARKNVAKSTASRHVGGATAALRAAHVDATKNLAAKAATRRVPASTKRR